MTMKIMLSSRMCALALAASLTLVAGAVRAEEVKIGFTAALSGDFAAFGLNMRKGLDLAFDDLNQRGGVTYSILAMDDRGDPKEGVLIAQNLCDNPDIDIVMGYSFSSVALAAVPIIDKCKLPVLASAVGSPELSGASPYFRRNLLTDAMQGALMGEYAAKTAGYKKVYVLHQQDDYGLGIAEAFSKAAEAAGASVIGTDSYLLGTKDFKTQIAKIRQSAPDAVFIGGFYTEAAKIAAQGRGMGLEAALLGTDGSLNPELIQLAGNAVEGMVLYGMYDTSLKSPATDKFLEAYRAKFGQDPNAWAALAYDAAYTLDDAVKIAKAKGEVNRETLNSAFAEIKGLEGVTGPTSFDEDGDRKGSIYFLKISGGKFVPVSN
ncbi:ABC transporter substrate-binding protein [Aquamicrobium soli]|jgi:branched-chain amino acid transport system substrate-binding protein|uniref:ABC transporter substrate-binding protein n=1 Tax=Aquamicrobium soli TaxID=1811518 RepID=A0ABV7KAX7_9HYPH